MKYVCELCGTVYDEEIGDVKRGVPAGTPFADLPTYYDCPICGSEKEAFTKIVLPGKITPVKPTCEKVVKYSEEHHQSER